LIEPETVWVKSLYLQEPAENLWRHDLYTDRKASLTIHSLGLKLSLDDLYAALDKLPQ
jgi:hypothetical protein